MESELLIIYSALAMLGIIAHEGPRNTTPEQVASRSMHIAKAMIAALPDEAKE